MRMLVAACLIVATVALFVVAVTAEPEARSETGTVLLAEEVCPCGVEPCAGHFCFASDHDIEFEDAEGRVVLKLPIETAGSTEYARIRTLIDPIHGTVDTGLRPASLFKSLLKLPRDGLRSPAIIDHGSCPKVEVLNVGAMA